MKQCVCGRPMCFLEMEPIHVIWAAKSQESLDYRIKPVSKCEDEWRRESEASGV